MPKFDFLADRLSALAAAGRLRSLVPRVQEGVFLVDAAGRRLVNFGSNDYLGLAADRAGSPGPNNNRGSGASALISGWSEDHERLAQEIAEFEQTESAVLFPSGYAACCGAIATLAQRGDLILSDALNHASLIDGCRLAGAQRIIYPHRDLSFVTETLAQRRREFDRVWLVTDGVFGMDGHVAPLDRLIEIAAEFDAHLIVDEAHGTGVLGDRGQGAGEACGDKDGIAVTIGTLSKSIGAQGGFVAAPRVVVDYLINRCRTLIYSTSLAPAAVTAARNGIRCIREEPQRRERVQNLARRFRRRLSLIAPPIETGVPIIPVIIGPDEQTVDVSQRLAELGFFVPAIRPPTVPEATGRLRVSLSSAHSDEMVDALAEAILSLEEGNGIRYA